MSSSPVELAFPFSVIRTGAHTCRSLLYTFPVPTIPLASGLGIEVDGTLAPGATLTGLLPAFQQLAPLTLAAVPRAAFNAGLKFSHDLPLPGDLGLTIAANSTGRLTIVRDQGRALDEGDPFQTITLDQGETYLAFSFSASIQPGASLDTGPLSFGFTKGLSHSWKIYRRFPDEALFGESLAQLLHGFVIPSTRDELRLVPEGVVLVFAGSGSITTSASFSFSMLASPLANLSLPGGLGLNAQPGLSLSLAPSLTLEGGYQVRIRKIAGPEVEIGLYQNKSSTQSLSIAGRAALPLRLGSFELTEQLIRAFAIGQPLVSREEMFAALPDEEDDFKKQRRIELIEEQLRKAVSTKFEASARISLGKTSSREPVWAYSVDPHVASPAADNTVNAALRGDFRDLIANPPGVRRLSSALADTETRSARLDINLLGLANFTSSTRLVMASRVEFDDRDQITMITDTSSVARVEALLANLGGDRRRLRRLMSESFLIQAAYTASGLNILPPRFRARHTYFEVHGNTSRAAMRDNLQALQALGLISPERTAAILDANQQFGRTTLYLETAYDSAAIDRLFFDQLGPRPQRAFEDAGRSALGALIAGDENRQLSARFAQLSPAADAFWEKMKAAGTPGLHQVFGIGAVGASGNLPLQVATSDFFAILDWAKAMRRAAQAAAEVRDMLGNKQVESADPRFETARQLLRARLTAVVARTSPHFGDPLGLLMVHVASSEAAKTGAILLSHATGRLLLGELHETAAAVGS